VNPEAPRINLVVVDLTSQLLTLAIAPSWKVSVADPKSHQVPPESLEPDSTVMLAPFKRSTPLVVALTLEDKMEFPERVIETFGKL
jgi:hypothetical protein